VKTSVVARRLRKVVETGSVANAMQTVVCAKCGDRFAIHNGSSIHDADLGVKQAAWIQDQLVWDHIQERKHHGTMELPDLQ